MEQTDDDPGHHPYGGTLPSTNSPPQYHPEMSARYERALERAIRAENRIIRDHDPWKPTKADRVSSALWAMTATGFAAAQAYAGIESLTISSTIIAYLGR